MIRRVVDFALGNRLLVLGLAFVLFVWGIISFHNLPIEAYPDVADNYVEVITQWPGISAEQIEQQVTIPLEIAMNGVPQVVHQRSFSLFGLSDIKLIFTDDSDNNWNRERALEICSRLRRTQLRQLQRDFALYAIDFCLVPPFPCCFHRGHCFANAEPSVIKLAEFRIGRGQM